MKKGLILVLAVALLVVASTASAAVFGKGKAQFSLGLTQFLTNSIDTAYFAAEEHNPLGFAGSFKYNFAEHWALDLGGFYGFASDKYEVSSTETKYSVNAFGFRLGLDYTENLGEMFGVYLGPGFEYLSARSKGEGDPFFGDYDNPRVPTISLDGRIGAQAMLSAHFGLNANMGQKWSYSSKSVDISGVENKVSRWSSSVNGFAGFVIYVN